MKKILLLCALFAFVTANVAMAQGVTKSYKDYQKYREGNESYEQYQKRLDSQARANKVGELMERLNEATNGKIEELANGKTKGKTQGTPANKIVKINPVVTPEAVDLGLPSGTLWASMNLGAKVPTEVGNYYSGGEAQPKSQFTMENYKFYDKATGYVKNYPGDIAGTKYDPAFVALGGHWRMPNRNQTDELLTKCNCIREEVNGVNCFRFIGPNGNSILIPFNNTIAYDQEIKPEDDMFVRWSDLSEIPFLAQGVPVRPVYVDPSLVAELRRKAKEAKAAAEAEAARIAELKRLEMEAEMKNQEIETIKLNYVDLGTGVFWSVSNFEANAVHETGTFVAGSNIEQLNKTLPYTQSSLRVPTKEQINDLIQKCTWEKTTVDGVTGYKVTGKNGNSIFFPCGGNSKNKEAGEAFYLWSADAKEMMGLMFHEYMIHKKGKASYKFGSVDDKFTVRLVLVPSGLD